MRGSGAVGGCLSRAIRASRARGWRCGCTRSARRSSGSRAGCRPSRRSTRSPASACSELVTEAYRRSFFGEAGAARLASARAGNVFGGGDWAADRLVPDLMRAAEAGEPVRLRHPDAIRPWQHVLNPLSGYLLLAERAHAEPACAAGWNFGPPDDDAR